MLNSQTQSQSAMSMLGYVPALIVQHLLNLKMNKLVHSLPEKQNIKSVVMFADISGFTRLTETLSQLGTEGAERIAFAINRYMELLVQGIGKSGGDIFKFAGDAMIVIWPPPPDGKDFLQNLETLLKQAIQSALLIQGKLTKTTIEQGIQLSVKIGFGVGEMSIIHVGGVFNRIEYLATGDPLLQAFSSEHCQTEGGKIIVSQQVYNLINSFFDCKNVEDHDGFYEVIQMKSTKVKMKADALLIKNNITIAKFQAIKNEIQQYIPAALIPYIDINEESWSAELRKLSVLFVNLGIDLNDAKSEKGLAQIQRVIMTVQKCIYMHEGSLNKLLMDDKGSTLIIVFGLPPLAHQNDSVRAILTAQLMLKELPKIQCQCSIGIVTGTVFAGVVGTSGSRREYSVLGDSVNLAARLMQAACEEKEHKILVCGETARSAENNMCFMFLKSKTVKGKNQPVDIYVPLINLPQPSSGNQFPDLHTHNFSFGFKKKSDFTNCQMFGRDDQYKKILNQLDKTLRGVDKKGLIIIKGTYGIGKTMLVKKVLHRIKEKLNSNQFNTWKYGELPTIIISQLDPITKGYKLNGLRSILKQIFVLFAKRLEREPNLELFHLMIEEKLYCEATLTFMKELLGLQEIKSLDNFPKSNEDQLISNELKNIALQFLSNFFEQIPEKYSSLYEGRSPEELGWEIKQQNTRQVVKYSIKYGTIMCPVVLCLDDMQNYDELTFKILSLMIQTYDRVFVLGLYRDSFQELSLFPKPQKKTQEEIALDGLSKLEDAIEQNYYQILQLKGIDRKGKDDDFSRMIRHSFNIRQFEVEKKYELRGRDNTIISDVQIQETINKEMNHPFLFFQNKQLLLEKDIESLFQQYIYVKTSGIPLMILNLIQNLIDQDFVKLINGSALITNEMINLITYEESIIVDVPSDRIEVNGPIIDKLSCLEQLILKTASVIGDVFDIQILNKINPFKIVLNNRLQKMLDELEQKDFIEIMEIQEQNVYYRFTCPFMRDSLYQRITFKQRRALHKAAAEAIQILPLSLELDEKIESKRLQFHWLLAEQNNQISPIEKVVQPINIRTIVLKFLGSKEPQQQQLANQYDNLSSKAMRSIILKQISNKLTKNNNNVNTILKEGILQKKSKQHVSWAPRYWVLDCKEMRCYYNIQDIQKKEMPLCTIPLKAIFLIIPLDVKDQLETNFPLAISATAWFKKNKEMGERRFLLKSKSAEDLEMWTIYLEFAKAKAVYDDFTNNFGKINFPLGNNNDYYDPEFKYDVLIEKQKLQLGIQYDKQQVRLSRGSYMSRSSRTSRFTIATKQFKFMEKTTLDDNQLQNSQIVDSLLLKERVNTFLQKSMLLLFSHLFDMSLQKYDDYILIGQPNMAMKKMNNIFKIDKSLITDNRKSSNAFNQSVVSNNSGELVQPRKGITLESSGIQIKKVETSIDEGQNDSDDGNLLQTRTLQQILEEEYDNEGQSIKMSETTIQKQAYLKQSRIQNHKYSLEEELVNKMKNSLRGSQQIVQQTRQESDTAKSPSSQESFEQNVQISRRNTDRQDQAKQLNYFKKVQPHNSIGIQSETKQNIAVQVSSLDASQINKSLSKSSLEKKSDTSQIDNQEFLKLFENSTQIKHNKVSEDFQKRDTRISTSNILSCIYPIQQSTQLSANTQQKTQKQYASRTSQLSYKFIPQSSTSQPFSPSRQSQYAIYGTALNTCKSLSGDIFTLRPGNRVIITKTDYEKKLIYCQYQNMQGLFYLRDIAVYEEQNTEKIEMKPRTPSTFEIKYKELLNERFNTKSKSPNYRQTTVTQARSKTPTKKPFMRF